ncbi:XXYS1_4_G0045470.mRNA.1.CDS.1 [Saccharomyces cerevisiae]|nr:XXYS1_4_G0045470.mRNA.1.CDS.1 [Saccharomyces cerevisiae]CAD6609314.1 EM14S01-3B_G0042890.mRNA.1.CDS.1 [Saccharomyces cerevisiae]CAI4327314.1 AMH_1a_G0008560.mRNA.1.CDS.1 [Saccharomyces cerevisiae]CAI4335306.1 CEI_1a_G0008510.mRNA.1.CDS.1 [Saccharomyces cerevisiae]CAI6545625.1 AMH_1a_G0008560.mRNA.1.CDS.1 [Saccharomyces cerevisiae]
MSAQDYYGNSASKQSYSRPSAPPPGYETASRGYAPSQSQQNYYPPQQQQQYHQQQPQYYQQQQPQYYQQHPQHPQQPIYVQQQPASSGNEDCLAGCLAGLCLCCTLDMLF